MLLNYNWVVCEILQVWEVDKLSKPREAGICARRGVEDGG